MGVGSVNAGNLALGKWSLGEGNECQVSGSIEKTQHRRKEIKS